MTPAVQAWLADLTRRAAWQPTATAPPAGDAPVLRLWRDGVLRATVQLDTDTAWLALPGRPTANAALTPAAAASLKAGLLDATR